MKILLLTDQSSRSSESAIEAIFCKYLRADAEIDLVYFDRDRPVGSREGARVILPWGSKRWGLLRQLGALTDIHSYDVIVVRNFFPVLRQVLSARLKARVGFWESFPHTWRHYEQSRLDGSAGVLDLLSWRVKNLLEDRLLSECAFYWPITDRHRMLFRPSLGIPSLAVPMGVDVAELPPKVERESKHGPLRFVYIGAIDKMRRNDLVHDAFRTARADFRLDYFSSSRNETVEGIRQRMDDRMSFSPGLPRADLFNRIADADVGICFLPEIRTYLGSSPTKILEYMALGICPMANHFGGGDPSRFPGTLLTPMRQNDITATVERVCRLGRQTLPAVQLDPQFDYRNIAADVLDFLKMG